jgi:molybdenum cofactor biosynthesis enzyme MoaA
MKPLTIAAPPDAPRQPLHALDHLWFQVGGTLCNLECSHCFISCGPDNREFGMMGPAEVERLLEESKRLGVKEYYFTGGEPFLNRDLPAILEMTLRLGPATVLTNATLLPERTLAALRRLDEASPYSLEIRVSIDGACAATNDPIRGPGTFEMAMQGVRGLLRHGFLPIITAMQADGATEGFEEFCAALKAAGYERPRLKLIPPLRIGREARRSRGYTASERVSAKMMLGYDDSQLLCSYSRMATDRGVYVCPILIESASARLGDTLSESLGPHPLGHSACYSCYLYGSICSNAASAQRPA